MYWVLVERLRSFLWCEINYAKKNVMRQGIVGEVTNALKKTEHKNFRILSIRSFVITFDHIKIKDSSEFSLDGLSV